MPRWLCDIAREQVVLVEPRKKPIGWAASTAVVHPLRHRAHGPLRAITIINLEGEASIDEVGLDLLECDSDATPQNAFGRAVAGQRLPDKIVGPRITDILNNRGIDVTKVDKARRQGGLRERCHR